MEGTPGFVESERGTGVLLRVTANANCSSLYYATHFVSIAPNPFPIPMTNFPAFSRPERFFRKSLPALATLLLCFTGAARAATYYYDASGASSGNLTYGSGTIGASNANWWISGAGSEVGWPGGTTTMQIGSSGAVGDALLYGRLERGLLYPDAQREHRAE